MDKMTKQRDKQLEENVIKNEEILTMRAKMETFTAESDQITGEMV